MIFVLFSGIIPPPLCCFFMLYPWKIIGHERLLSALENEIQQQSFSHAYLFYGPEHVGKFSIAMMFAKILLCPNKLCHTCSVCRQVESAIHPDFLLLLDEGERLKIDMVRDLIAKVNLTTQGKRRVVLIDNVDRMPHEAQNAFLKTLEEPPGDTIFLLTTSHIKRVLPTILSRVRSYEFSLVSDDLIQNALASEMKDTMDLKEIVQMAQGKPGLAFEFVQEPAKWHAFRQLFYQVERFLEHDDLLGKFDYVQQLEQDQQALNDFFQASSLALRKAIYDFMRGQSLVFGGRYHLLEITELFDKLLETRYFTERNVNKKLALENFFLLTERSASI